MASSSEGRLERMAAEGTYDFAVVGRGMIGSAAARYVSRRSSRVAIFGEAEPADLSGHAGAFASHYDSSRFYRVIDQSTAWARMADRARGRYSELEAESGITFHRPHPYLQVSKNSPAALDEYGQLEAIGRDFGAESVILPTSTELNEAFPKLQFPEGMLGQVETERTAGVLNPRLFVAAELTAARRQGATLIPERVVAVEPGRGHVTLRTSSGSRYEAGKALIAAGAWSHFLLQRPVRIILEAVAVVLGEVPASEAFAFPSLIYNRIPTDPDAEAGYLMSAVEYPDGKFYVKGGWYWSSTVVETGAELNAYFRSPITRNSGKADRELFTGLVPDLQAVRSWSYRPCVHMRTRTHLPYIDEIEPGHIYVAFGGNGLAAKCGDEIGRLGAELTASGRWGDAELPAADFKVAYA